MGFKIHYWVGVRGNNYLSVFILKEIPLRRLNLCRDLFSHFCHLTDDEGKDFSDEEVCDQILFVLFAAHDTAASALSAILYALASNQSWQQTLRQDILSLNKDDFAFDDAGTMQKNCLDIKRSIAHIPCTLYFWSLYTRRIWILRAHYSSEYSDNHIAGIHLLHAWVLDQSIHVWPSKILAGTRRRQKGLLPVLTLWRWRTWMPRNAFCTNTI